MKPKVKEQNEIISVPVLYGNEERWKSIQSRNALRDKNGVIILPIIVIKRTSVGFDDAMPLSFDNDVQGKFISVIRSSSGWSKNNRYDRFAILTGQKPVQEFVKTGMPDFVVCSYSIVMMTSFIEQMNDLNSKLDLKELSMGMSSDYLDAIENNATFIRIGSSIFGERS